MHAAADRLAFAPPPQPGLLRAFALALTAHLLLVLALMSGLRWQRDSQVVAAEAELWSRLPQEAAPREVAPPPPEPPKPEVKPVPRAEPPPNRDAEIAQEREKERRDAAQRKQAELERQRKLEAQRKKEEQEALRKKEQEEARVAEAKRKAEDDKKKRQQELEAQRVAKLREDNIRRSVAMAGTGAPSATGEAARSSGPSASYAGRIAALIKSNTRFTDTVSGDPVVDVEIRLAPDGTIVGQRILRSSGNRQRDEAVLRGIEATGKIPRNEEGRIFTPMIVSVRQFG